MEVCFVFSAVYSAAGSRSEAPSQDFLHNNVAPVATCQGRIHHFSSRFLGLPCFPCSKSWRMTRFNLSSTLWVLVAELRYYFDIKLFCRLR